MSDTPNSEQQQQEQVQSAPTSSQTENSDTHMIPKSRFDEVNTERNELRQRLQALEEAERQKQEQQLADEKRYDELYKQTKAENERLSQYKEVADRYQQALHQTNQARIEAIPEERRSLVPEYDDPVKLGKWLDSNLSLLSDTPKPKAPSLNGGSGGNSQDATPVPAKVEGFAELAQQLGYRIDKERLAKRFQQRQNNGD